MHKIYMYTVYYTELIIGVNLHCSKGFISINMLNENYIKLVSKVNSAITKKEV